MHVLLYFERPVSVLQVHRNLHVGCFGIGGDALVILVLNVLACQPSRLVNKFSLAVHQRQRPHTVLPGYAEVVRPEGGSNMHYPRTLFSRYEVPYQHQKSIPFGRLLKRKKLFIPDALKFPSPVASKQFPGDIPLSRTVTFHVERGIACGEVGAFQL